METLKTKFGAKIAAIAVIILLLVGSITYFGWYNFFREIPTYYESSAEQIKYGAIGPEKAEVMPYWLWVVLPRLFPEYLDDKGGYFSLGFQWEAGEEIPIGITKFKAGDIDLVAFSCSDCDGKDRNLSSFTSQVSSNRLKSPNLNFDRDRYQQFLANCAQDPRFSASYILPAIEYNHRLSLLEKQRYRWLFIPKVKKQLLAQA